MAVMNSLLNASEFFSRLRGPYHKAKELGLLCRYSFQVQGCRRPKAVNVDELVKKWVEVLAAMSAAHNKDDYDAADYESDELLAPLLMAPVKQVRAFYENLLVALEADKRIPWVVRIGFEAWGNAVVKDAPDEGVKRLKNKLAAEIAELVEEPIRDQIPKAIERALRWRDAETLEAVKEQLEKGVKPKLRGRESCLFLHVGKKAVML